MQGGTGAVGLQIKEVVPWRKEHRGIIAFAFVTLGPEILIGLDVGVVTASDMIRDEVDHCLHPVLMHSTEQALEFIQALGRIPGVIGAEVEVVLNRIGAPGEAFEQVRVVSGLTDGGIIGSRRLL